MGLARLFRTVRHLQPEQVWFQLRYRLPGGTALAETIPRNPPMRWRGGGFLAPPAGRNERGALLKGRFVFLNRRVETSWPPDWTAGGDDLLWSYNLHYFDWLWLLRRDEARAVVADWIGKSDPAKVPPAWDPYPVSLRLINWLGVFGASGASGASGESLPDSIWGSVYCQVEWLRRRVERHLGANHLLENAAALALAGSAFGGDAAGGWLREGEKLLERELPVQFPADGLHFERSPMYHLRALYVLELLCSHGTAGVAALAEPARRRARRALATLCHPDGGIALLNDSAFRGYHEPSVLLDGESWQEGGNLGAFALPDAGYYGFRDGEGNYVVCDAGRIGPDFQPGHSHGDVLAFELTARGQRMIVDTGVFEYVVGERRDVSRSTRAHNTVEIDGADQAEFWGGFRVGARPSVAVREWLPRGDGFTLEAEHDGYARLACGAVHRRRFEWRSGEGLRIADSVRCRRAATLRAFYHLHPDCGAELGEGGRAELNGAGVRLRVTVAGTGELRLVETPYYPEFGVEQRRLALEYTVAADAGVVEFSTLVEIDG